jgi:NADPH:quinone reductase
MAHRPVVMKRKLSLSAARPPTSRKAREVGHPQLAYSTIQSQSRYDRAGEVGHPPGADQVLLTDGKLAERVRALAPDGVHHVVEVAFAANIKTDMQVLAQGGSISTYATNAPTPEIPFWELVFVNARIFFVGSDDIPADAKLDAARAINQALDAGWLGLDIADVVPLDDIARAHELVEHPVKPGRVIVAI